MILIQYNSCEKIIKGEVRERPIGNKIRDDILALQILLCPRKGNTGEKKKELTFSLLMNIIRTNILFTWPLSAAWLIC